MTASSWFKGLKPRPEDLGTVEQPFGQWVAPSTSGAGDLQGALDRGIAESPLPRALIASIAVMDCADDAERQLAVALVTALAGYPAPGRWSPRVVVTLDPLIAADTALIRGMRQAGAVVVIGGGSMTEDHLHHYPARAITIPRSGQLIGVDAADHLDALDAGAVAHLHSIPSDLTRALAALEAVRPPWPVRGMILDFLIDGPESPLTLYDIDRLATACRQDVFPGIANMLFTTREGTEGLVDVLLISDPIA